MMLTFSQTKVFSFFCDFFFNPFLPRRVDLEAERGSSDAYRVEKLGRCISDCAAKFRWASFFSVIYCIAVAHLSLSANTLAKLANGLCDNLLTCVARAWDFKGSVEQSCQIYE